MFSSIATVRAEKPHGTIVAWGTNEIGQLDVPEPNADFIAVSAGGEHSLGLKASGIIMAWGGEPRYGLSDVPAPNGDFVAIAAGYWHNLALKADGSIVAWGYNDAGQLNVPQPNDDFIAIAAGPFHSLGLKADGSVVAWGCRHNNAGQCDVPTPNTGFVGISAGYFHSLGLKADGSVVAWGLNSGGQTTAPAHNSNFIAISAGYNHSSGLRSNGSIEVWGDGSIYPPPPNTDYIAIATGGAYILGLKTDGSIRGSGDNYSGQIDVPEPNIGFIAIAGGCCHGLALREATGACCDTHGQDRGCRDNVSQSNCSDVDDVWTENATCETVSCQCVFNCNGRECGDDGCGGSCGICDDGLFCNGVESCDSQGHCVGGTPPCDPEIESCDEAAVLCVPDRIPTVTEWGLVILTLLLLTSAKVAFSRKNSDSASAP